MSSTITGDSGRIYTNSTLLRKHPQDSKYDIYKVEFGNKIFVFKHASKHFFDLSQRIANDFPSSQRLRIHVDCNRADQTLFYPCFRDTLLALLQDDPAFSPDERMKIMRRVGEAVQELHAMDWAHTDIKPDNILVDWTVDSDRNKVVTDVALGDFDIACQLKEGETRITPHAVGNAMWRSPEGQACLSSKASDIYSLGLVFIYALGGGELLILKDYQDLVKAGITAEQEIVTKHFCYFGPVPESFYQQTKDEEWRHAFRMAARVAEAEVEERPMLRMKVWGEELGETAVELLTGMTNLDPKDRLTIEQVLDHAYWRERAS